VVTRRRAKTGQGGPSAAEAIAVTDAIETLASGQTSLWHDPVASQFEAWVGGQRVAAHRRWEIAQLRLPGRAAHEAPRRLWRRWGA
jgi:hypothetical protein